MNRIKDWVENNPESVPRRRGDEPDPDVVYEVKEDCSPQARG